MSVLLRIIDQTPGRPSVNHPNLDLPLECVTARAIIARRVEAEVAALNTGEEPRPSHVFEPAAAECALNGARSAPVRWINPVRSVEIALEAFAAKRFLLLLNGKQVVELDMPLILAPDSEARFLRLVPLVGG